MSVSRRSFLKRGALTALSASFALQTASVVLAQDATQSNPAVDFQIPYEAKADPVFYYTRATFEPYLNTTFRARARAKWVNLQLVKISDRSPSVNNKLTPRARPSESFALLFRASAPLTELTTIQQLEHGALGKFALFLVRKDDAKGRAIYYEAIINHVQP